MTRNTFITAALLLGASGAGAQASLVSLTTEVHHPADNFMYNYSLLNGSDFDLFVFSIEIPGAPLPQDAIFDLSAPEGFEGIFDADFGFVDFLGITGFVAPGESADFSFTSEFAPVETTYAITGLDFFTGEQVTFTGTTFAPLIPAPATSGVALGALAAAFRRRRA